jgi:hypothetical protein
VVEYLGLEILVVQRILFVKNRINGILNGYTNSQLPPPREERIVQYVCFLPRGDRKTCNPRRLNVGNILTTDAQLLTGLILSTLTGYNHKITETKS